MCCDAPEEVICSWCQHKFTIVPSSTIGAFKCPECGEESCLGLLRNPNLNPNAIKSFGYSADAITLNLSPYLVGYIVNHSNGQQELASGTAVEIRDHLLLATVKHAAPKNPQDAELIHKGSILSSYKLDFVRNIFRHPTADVAILEIDKLKSIEIAGVKSIRTDRIHDAQAGDDNLLGRLLGYPADSLVKDQPFKGMKGFYSLSYGCETIDPCRWKALKKRWADHPDDKRDILVNWDPQSSVEINEGVMQPSQLPEPFGMSGGGLWQRKRIVSETDLWSADGYCLIGIQSSWLKDDECLKVTQIAHWLALVAKEYPQYKDLLHGEFPRLKSLSF